MRLDKFLVETNVASRSDSQRLIRKGMIFVNDVIIKDPKTHIKENEDVVLYEGDRIIYKEHYHIMLNKPQDYVTANVDNLHKTVMDLIDNENIKKRVSPSGRLDIDTEGFVFLTSDGKLNHFITGPKSHLPKQYYVEVDGSLNDNDILKFKEGIVLDDGYKTLPAELTILKNGDISSCEVIIYEGKFHQIKRMFADLGRKVLYLRRDKIGGLELDKGLKLGEYREVSEDEILMLKNKCER